MKSAETRMLRWMCGVTRLDKIGNECSREEFRRIIDMAEKTPENRSRKFWVEEGEGKRYRVDYLACVG